MAHHGENMNTAQKKSFEVETCTRCGGTGKHSFCQQYLDVCFKCRGAGRAYTKRGAAAVEFLYSLMQITVDQLKTGDLVFHEGKYRPVSEIRSSSTSGIQSDGSKIQFVALVFVSPKGEWVCHMHPEQKIRVKGANYPELLNQAYTYQDSLTKTGNPKKR